MSLVSAPADKRFRRAHVKPSRRRSAWRAYALPGLLVGVLVVGGAAAFVERSAILARATVLQIDRIVVHGNGRVPTEAVLAALDGLHGQNLMQADLEVWREKLSAWPWIEAAALRRVLPSTVEVTLTERTPVVIGRLKGRLMLVDPHGIVIDEFGPSHAGLDLPIVDGLDVAAPTPGAQADAARVALVGRLLTGVQADTPMARRISQIDVADVHNAQVTLDGDSAVLHVGDAEFLPRLRTYVEMAPALRASVPDIEYVDLRFGERIYVGPAGRGRSSSAPPHAGRAPGRGVRGRTRE